MPQSANAWHDRAPIERRRPRGSAGRDGKAGAWAPITLQGSAFGRSGCRPAAV
jgi:hypothetical protein